MADVRNVRSQKKLERKRIKQRKKRWKRINAKIDGAITKGVLAVAGVIAVMEVLEALKENKSGGKR